MMTVVLVYIGIGMLVTLLLVCLLTITGQSIAGVLKDHDERLGKKSDTELEIKFSIICVFLWPLVVYGASMGQG